jgi:hypothetical protein
MLRLKTDEAMIEHVKYGWRKDSFAMVNGEALYKHAP